MGRKAIRTIEVRVQDLRPTDVMLYGTSKNSQVWREVKEVNPRGTSKHESVVEFTDGWPGTYRNLDLVTIQHEVSA